MKRYRFASGLLVLVGWMTGSVLPGVAAPPNVLFIAVDDLNDWIGPLGGHPQTVTPNLDRLAARGMIFTNAHCAAPACNPSRAALMTSIRPSTSGVYHNPQPWRESPVLRNAITLPQYLRQHGYVALGSGKIYHGSFPDAASWDTYWPDQRRNRPGDPQPTGRPLNGIPRTAHFDWGPVEAENSAMGDWQVAQWTAEQLQQQHDRPFFLACGLYRPHLPWYVPPDYFARFPLDSIRLPEVLENDLADVPPLGVRMARPDGDHAKVLAHDQWRNAVQGYLASIAFADECLGIVLDALDAGPHRDNTIVVLWSDHGWHLGEKKHWRKFALWEEATRVVLMWAVPGTTHPNTRCDAPVNLLDIYPTLVDLCDLPPREKLEGVSLRPLLEKPESEWSRPSLTTHGRNNHALRSQRYRYIHYADGTEELYDHESDPHEWHNLAGHSEHTVAQADLSEWLPKENAEESHTPPRPRQNRRRQRRENRAP